LKYSKKFPNLVKSKQNERGMGNKGEIIIYQAEDRQAEIEVRLVDNTLWLNVYQMADVFQTDRSSISKHLKNIYDSSELDENSTCAKFAQVQTEGERNIKRKIKYFNLDVILAHNDG
jgi:hypothetical protein